MAAKSKPFGFPPSAPPAAPEQVAGSIRKSQLTATFLVSALVAGVLLNVGLGLLTLNKATVEPYATDGSLFGCRLREHATAPVPIAAGDVINETNKAAGG